MSQQSYGRIQQKTKPSVECARVKTALRKSSIGVCSECFVRIWHSMFKEL